MCFPTITATVALGLLLTTSTTITPTLAAPTTAAPETSLYYKLRARVTGEQDAVTPAVDGWPVELRKLATTTHGVPADWQWGVLFDPRWNGTTPVGRGGDVFYTQPSSSSSSSSDDDDGDAATHVRTNAANASTAATQFGFSVGEPFAGLARGLVSVEIVGTALLGSSGETATAINVTDDGVPHLVKPAFAQGVWVACSQLGYPAWATLYWTDVAAVGTDGIYAQESWRNCTEVQLVAECAAEGPAYEGLMGTACLADAGGVL